MKSEYQLNTENSESLINQFLVIQIGDTHYAIKLAPIREIVIIPNVTPLPDSPEFVRGVIKLRSSIITLIDSRKRLGFSMLDELDKEMIKMLKERENDHVSWIQSLASSVERDIEFTKTTDPHACEFGKWLDNFKTDNIGLSVYIKQFDLPHKRIHAAAERAIAERKANGVESAMKIIDEARRTDFKQILDIFNGVSSAIRESHRELAIVVQSQDGLIAIAADNVSNIFTFNEDQIQQSEISSKNRFIFGSINHDGDIYLMLDLDKLVSY